MQSFYIVAGGIVTILAIVIFLVWRISESGAKMIAEEQRRVESARKARAKILAVGESRAQRNSGKILVKIRFEVFPLNLYPSFETSTVWEVEPAMIGEIAVGKTLSVKFDEADKTCIYPLAPWANFNFLQHKLIQRIAPVKA